MHGERVKFVKEGVFSMTTLRRAVLLLTVQQNGQVLWQHSKQTCWYHHL